MTTGVAKWSELWQRVNRDHVVTYITQQCQPQTKPESWNMMDETGHRSALFLPVGLKGDTLSVDEQADPVLAKIVSEVLTCGDLAHSCPDIVVSWVERIMKARSHRPQESLAYVLGLDGATDWMFGVDQSMPPSCQPLFMVPDITWEARPWSNDMSREENIAYMKQQQRPLIADGHDWLLILRVWLVVFDRYRVIDPLCPVSA